MASRPVRSWGWASKLRRWARSWSARTFATRSPAPTLPATPPRTTDVELTPSRVISPASTSSSTHSCTPTTAAATTSSPASRSMSSVASSTMRGQGRLHRSRVGRGARPAVRAGRRRARAAARAPTRPGAGPHTRHADGRHRDWRAPGHRRRRRGGVVRRVRRAAHRRPAAGPCAQPRARLAHARARAMATTHRLRHHAERSFKVVEWPVALQGRSTAGPSTGRLQSFRSRAASGTAAPFATRRQRH